MSAAARASRFGSFERGPGARLRLFCFPHAGGGVAPYYTWRRDLPPAVQVCPVHLPGREDRIDEAPATELPALVTALADALAPALDLPCALFGHSMGALLAFELARELRRRAARGPVHLFVSARRAPHVPDPAAPFHHLADPEFLAELARRYNGIPAAVLADPELVRLFLRPLRADIQLLETYAHCAEPPLECPVSAFAATDDRVVAPEAVASWGDLSSGRFILRMIQGEHFFLTSARAEVLGAIREDLAAHLGPPAP
jgi:surfactin synthase thioesterase subunit